jgi:hypothetical protein
MSAAFSPPPPVRSAARTSPACAGTGLSRVDTPPLLGASRLLGAAVSTPASSPPCGLEPPTATS